MKYFRTIVLSASLLGTCALVAQPYQAFGYQDRGERQSYRAGFEEGRSDAASGRRAHPNEGRYRDRDDREAFRRGYEEGYRSAQGHGGFGHNNAGYGNSAYGGGGFNGGMQVARQNGMRDGMNDGRKDRSTGHSFRPTQDDNYKNAPGYSSSMGDRQQYKDAYRSAYQQGYQQGYNGGGGGWRR
jgi:hypothetical protein